MNKETKKKKIRKPIYIPLRPIRNYRVVREIRKEDPSFKPTTEDKYDGSLQQALHHMESNFEYFKEKRQERRKKKRSR